MASEEIDSFFDSLVGESRYYHISSLPNEIKENSNNRFSIMQLNARSLLPKLAEISCLADELKNLGIIAISESWLNDDTESLVNIDGFKFINRNRQHKHGGGVGIFVADRFEFTVRHDLCPLNNVFDWVAIELLNCQNTNSKNIIVYSIYRPPNTDVSFFIEQINTSLKLLKHQPDNNIYLCGDFYIDLLNQDCHNIYADFVNILASLSFFPLITSSTRITSHSTSLIDNIFSNSFTEHITCILLSDISDHLPILAHRTLSNDPKTSKTHLHRKINIKNLNKLNEYFALFDWNSISIDDVNAYSQRFMDVFNNALNLTCPLENKVMVGNKHPWLTKGLRKSSVTKSKLYKRFISHPSNINHTKYKVYRNKFNKILLYAEKQYYHNLFTENATDA